MLAVLLARASLSVTPPQSTVATSLLSSPRVPTTNEEKGVVERSFRAPGRGPEKRDPRVWRRWAELAWTVARGHLRTIRALAAQSEWQSVWRRQSRPRPTGHGRRRHSRRPENPGPGRRESPRGRRAALLRRYRRGLSLWRRSGQRCSAAGAGRTGHSTRQPPSAGRRRGHHVQAASPPPPPRRRSAGVSGGPGSGEPVVRALACVPRSIRPPILG